jgi:predicted transcriptional regulator
MNLQGLAALLECEVVWGHDLLDRREVKVCFAADLMSDVLAFSEPGALLITGLASLQSVHAADVADLTGLLYVGAKRPANQVLELARQRSIPLLTTRHSMFDVCAILREAGLKAGCKD